jgi:type III secretion protein C
MARSTYGLHYNLRRLILCLLIAYAGSVTAITPPSWKQTAYAYKTDGLTLAAVLREFGTAFGVRVDIPPSLATVWVTGDHQSRSAIEYLDTLGNEHRFVWFVYAGTLYVSPLSDVSTKRIQVPYDSAQELTKALRGIGLLEPKFGWGELNSEGEVLVSGPSSYVQLVRKLMPVKGARQRSEDSQMMVFRLKHAIAADREMILRERAKRVPGVASILRNLLGREPDSIARSTAQLSADIQGGSSSESIPTKVRDRSGRDIAIEADPRINAVLIYDDPARRRRYEDLIAQLDVPTRMVEIVATIIDVDASKLREWAPELIYSSGKKGGGVTPYGLVPRGSFREDDATVGITKVAPNIVIWSIDKLLPRIRLLETVGSAKVLSRPSVMTMENSEAILDLGTTAYMRLTGERVVDVRPITAGTMLKVTPRLVSINTQTSKIHAFVEVEDGQAPNISSPDAVLATRATINTETVLDESQALVIGGYRRDLFQNEVQKIPLLGDIPWIGALFRSEHKGDSSTERLFVITARALSPFENQERLDTVRGAFPSNSGLDRTLGVPISPRQ